MSVPLPLARLLLASPGLPEARRADLAGAAAHELRAAGRRDEADGVLLSAARKIASPRLRVALLAEEVSRSLAAGVASPLVREAYAAELAVADETYAAQKHRPAAEVFAAALRTATHRVLHFDSLTSPLADDPAGFTAPLRGSAVAQALRAPRGRAVTPGPTAGDGPATGTPRPTQLLIATRINADFLGEIREHFNAHVGFETRFVDFAEVRELDRFAKSPERIVLQTIAGKPGLRRTAEEAFRAHLDWADVVFVEWCTALAALLTQVDPGDTRIVVRMHSYEAFTLWPHLLDFSRVDDMVFVSDHLRDLAVAAIPGLQGPDAPRLHVIANAMDLRRYVRPKSQDARFTLGVIGASKMVKDPRWAIEVLRELRKHDERYRLVLVRGELQDPTPAAQAYAAALRRDLDELEPSGTVQVLGHTDDVPAALQDIGVVLSSSVRESFHMALVEGVASGALPVVRDWPFFPGAAAQLFPPDWVVGSPGQAAERILALTATEDQWRAACDEAAAHVLERWDWPLVSREFERLLTPRSRKTS